MATKYVCDACDKELPPHHQEFVFRAKTYGPALVSVHVAVDNGDLCPTCVAACIAEGFADLEKLPAGKTTLDE